MPDLLGALPAEATVVDVSARDGLQGQATALAPERRAAWVRAVLATGVPEAEATSFVSVQRVPQMAGADAVVRSLADVADRVWALVPNRTGMERALRAGARNVICVISATESHSASNLGRSVAEAQQELAALLAEAKAQGVRARTALSMAWVDPWEGEVPRPRVVDLCRSICDAGCRELTLCDTYGGASPRAVAELLEEVLPLFPERAVGVHFHDTFGLAGANALAALLSGAQRFDGAIGGLGGCPFAPGARGNLATEDLVALRHGLGV